MTAQRRGYSNVSQPMYLVGVLTDDTATDTISVAATPGGSAAEPAGWPTTYPYYAVISRGTAKEEVVQVTAGSGTTLTISRANNLAGDAYGSTSKAHNNAASIAHMATAADYDQANAHIMATSGVHGVAEGKVIADTSTPQTFTDKTLVNPIINGGIIDGATINNSGLVYESGTQTVANKTLTSSAIDNTSVIEAGTELSVGGEVVGTTATQTLSGKTLAQPIISGGTIDGATISNSGLLYQNGIQTAANKNIVDSTIDNTTVVEAGTLLSAGGEIVGTTATQTLTSKTLSSPTINGGTINNANVAGTLAVSGTSTLAAVNSGALTSTGVVSATNLTTSSTSNTSTIAGPLTVNGASTLKNTAITGTLTVNGAAVTGGGGSTGVPIRATYILQNNISLSGGSSSYNATYTATGVTGDITANTGGTHIIINQSGYYLVCANVQFYGVVSHQLLSVKIVSYTGTYNNIVRFWGALCNSPTTLSHAGVYYLNANANIDMYFEGPTGTSVGTNVTSLSIMQAVTL